VVNNDTTVECLLWSSVSATWATDACTFVRSISDVVVCRCTFSSTAVVAAYIQQLAPNGDTSAVVDDKYSIKLRMLSTYQWGLIIGVGVIGIAILLGAFAMSGLRVSKQYNSFLLLKSYTAVLKSDGEEPDVTIEDLSLVESDYSGTPDELSFSEHSYASDTDATSRSEDAEVQAPNSTRLSRMGVQEGATGYVVSSTTLRNTLETDYDLEKRENVGPITGTALRIRAQSLSTSTENPTNTTNFNTASRYALAAARPKISTPSISRATAAGLGFARGDSLRAIPASFFSPPPNTNTSANTNTTPTD